jgi:enamine deaminase RidA (YjgF/YER057c/UK114 family)
MKPGPVAAQTTASRSRSVARTIETHGCSIVLRRVDGPAARELFLHCQPPADVADPGLQAAAIYRAILGALEAEGGGFGSVVAETVFVRDLQANLAPVRAARRAVLAEHDVADHRPATTEIEQPPLDERACLEVSVQALLPRGSQLQFEPIAAESSCACVECTGARGLRVQVGDEVRIHAGGLSGPGDGAYEQTLGMFRLAEDLLRSAGMDFGDVVRTWIHMRDIDRDYGELNRARRAFFAARRIEPAPASTGIGGGPVPGTHDLCLGIYAVKAGRPLVKTVMTSPTLNEASEYGADFVRGLRVQETNKVALLVSGTASIDEHGRTAHDGDVAAQADRMLVNLAALLEGQGACFADVVHAVTYVKHPADAERIREKLRKAGFGGFPHALVVAPICRPDLLCETEALAVLPPPV